MIDHALELGVNFIDAAEMYAQGRSEEIVGKAVKGKRLQVIIATKFGHPISVGPREQGGSRNYIMKAVELCLRRLNTEYIDLYYFHYPDTETPIMTHRLSQSSRIEIGAGFHPLLHLWTRGRHHLLETVHGRCAFCLLLRCTPLFSPCQITKISYPVDPVALAWLCGTDLHTYY